MSLSTHVVFCCIHRLKTHAPPLYERHAPCFISNHTLVYKGLRTSARTCKPAPFAKGAGFKRGIQALFRVLPRVGAKNDDDLVASRGLRRKDDVAGTDAEGRGDLLGRLRIRGFRVENG